MQTAIDNAAPGTTLIVTGTCSGNFTIDKDLALLGQGTAVLDGQREGTTLSVLDPGATVRVVGLTVTGGSALLGGGIFNAGTLALRGSTVTDNGPVGGGILNAVSGTLTLKETTVSNNTNGLAGGGIFILTGTVTLADSTVSDNTAGQLGGGIFNGSGDLRLNNTTLSGNTAGTSGGGIFNGNNARLTESTVSDNTAGQNGGGIFNQAGDVTLNDTTVTSNVPDNCFPPGSVAGCLG